MACAFVECVNASQFRTKDNLITTVTRLWFLSTKLAFCFKRKSEKHVPLLPDPPVTWPLVSIRNQSISKSFGRLHSDVAILSRGVYLPARTSFTAPP
jgi:hypothetical protein